ncbi:MAG: GAD-like domain-containing protein [Gammaproteobacteria bacterium]
MDSSFKCLMEEIGKPDFSTPATTDSIEKYRGLLPDRLLEYLAEFGFCRFAKGLFWIVNPERYEHIKNDWLPDNVVDRSQCHVIARNAFADLYVWSKTHGHIFTIESVDGRVFLKDGDKGWLEEGNETRAIQAFLGLKEKDELDREDFDFDPEISIFDYAIEQFGPLAEDEMFTFEPALFLSGEQSCQNVRKVNLFIQLDILSNLAPKDVLDIHGLTKRAFS